MRKINEIYKELFDNKCIWDYYSGNDGLPDPFDPTENCNEFIKQFIEYSGKQGSVLFDKINKLEPDRLMHIVATFFLGIYLYENSDNIKRTINKELSQFKTKTKYSSKVTFSYMWYLMCLFHDLAYDLEKEAKYKSLATFQKHKCANKTLGKYAGVPEIYANNLPKYFKYMAKQYKKNDHGICAAHILYHDLCKIRKEQANLKTSNLFWEEALENVYNYAAWVILAHNMWYAGENDSDAKYYRCYGLGELILKENEYKISLEKYPFLFLFCLVDGIEPLKKMKKLEKISLGIETDRLVIRCQDRFLQSAKELNKWLTKTDGSENEVIVYLTTY
jgi:hypothetical protein